MNLRQAILSEARKQDPEIGDGAMIAEMEWGYWIGEVYVKKTEVAKLLPKTFTTKDHP